MKRVICVMAVLSCIALPAAAPAYAKASADKSAHRSAEEMALVRSYAAQVVTALRFASRSGTPIEILYGKWQTESKALSGEPGGCLAYQQYQIIEKWHPGRGKKHLEALAWIARISGKNMYAIRSSCGHATWSSNGGNYFGGALGPKQIMASSWMSDPEIVRMRLNPFDLGHALFWAGRSDAARYRGAPAPFNRSEHGKWEYAIRRYFGVLTSPMSNTYYSKVLTHWREWQSVLPAPSQQFLAGLDKGQQDAFYRQRFVQQTEFIARKLIASGYRPH